VGDLELAGAAEKEDRGGGDRRRLQDQRPGAHVPAQDGLGLAAVPRGRGGNIAKRIEAGEKEVLDVVLKSSLAVKELLALGQRLKTGKVRIREVVKEVDEEHEPFDEKALVTEKVHRIMGKIGKLDESNDQYREELLARKRKLAKQRRIELHKALEKNRERDGHAPRGDAAQQAADPEDRGEAQEAHQEGRAHRAGGLEVGAPPEASR
jgi:hypothetical protein